MSDVLRKPTIDGIEVFSTCPASTGVPQDQYFRHVIEVARWSEASGCAGTLVYSDNSLVDPWLVAHLIVQHTRKLCPLVAVQPIYTHPYAIAKLVSTIGYLYGRRVYLNMVAGGFKNDLTALNDPTPHDRRYDRLVEYTLIVKRLLEGSGPLTCSGEFYSVDKLKLTPPLPPRLFPGIFVSGSSAAGLEAAKALGATAIKYPKPANEEMTAPESAVHFGIRVGIIARPDREEAWAIAHARFPEDRKGQLTRQLALKVSDSAWHRQLGDMEPAGTANPYWLGPFHNYKTMCPYLVGSYDEVAEEIAKYVATEHRTFVLDVPPDAEELDYVASVFSRIELSEARS